MADMVAKQKEMNKDKQHREYKGCGDVCYRDSLGSTRCGDIGFGGETVYCDSCKLSMMGVTVGSRFYEFTYVYSNRVLHEHTVLRLNDMSVRIRTVFLRGSEQSPQEYATRNDEAIRRFGKYSKTVGSAIRKCIRLHEDKVKELKEIQKDIPDSIKDIGREISELNAELKKVTDHERQDRDI